MAGDESLRTLVESIRGDIRVVSTKVTAIEGDVRRIEKDVNEKHRQNRASIHEIRNFCQEIVSKVNRVEVKYAGLSVGSGALVAVAIKLIEHWWKN